MVREFIKSWEVEWRPTMHPLSISSRRHGIPEVIAFCALLGGLLGQPAAADTYWVGSGAGCTHATIQAAVNAAVASVEADEIRISQSQAYTQQQILIDQAQGNHQRIHGIDIAWVKRW